jgi:hypothetical protein
LFDHGQILYRPGRKSGLVHRPLQQEKECPFSAVPGRQISGTGPLYLRRLFIEYLPTKGFCQNGFPLPEGSPVTLHFYIPPDKKLLGEFQGRVMKKQKLNDGRKGTFIRIQDFLHLKLDKLEGYLEEKRHLVDGTW